MLLLVKQILSPTQNLEKVKRTRIRLRRFMEAFNNGCEIQTEFNRGCCKNRFPMVVFTLMWLNTNSIKVT